MKKSLAAAVAASAIGALGFGATIKKLTNRLQPTANGSSSYPADDR